MVADRDRSGKFRDRLSKPKKRQYEQDDDDQADEVNDAVHVISFRYELSDRIAVSYTHLDVYKRQLWFLLVGGLLLVMGPVSYTHLDVYKRQDTRSSRRAANCRRPR